MMSDAMPLWRALERECGETLLNETGAVNVGADLGAIAEAIAAGGATPERLDAAAVRERYGVVTSHSAVVDPSAGVVRADAAWRALAASAVRHGAQIKDRTRVTGIDARSGGVVVRTEDGAIDGDVAVVTAGPFARALLAPLGIALPVVERRETVAYFPLRAPVPVVLDWSDPLVYALPTPEGSLKVGRHITGPEADPEEPGAPDAGALRAASAWVTEHVPAAEPTPAASETCFYTVTEDERFVLERHGNVVVGSPCSGHGFKFAPLIGARLAALALAP
jgi:glycine/D-amino acid oxidase-like deaminating enzyme